MLKEPNLQHESIVSCLQCEYGLPVVQVTFLPLGADMKTAVYRATTADGQTCFCKLRSGVFDQTSVDLPNYLCDQGIKQIIAPYATRTGALWAGLDRFTVVLYPFALAYYRYERIVEDIAVYCQQLFLTDKGGQDREQSLRYLQSNWAPNGTIEIACRSDKTGMQYARGGAKKMSVEPAGCESYTIRVVASVEELREALDLLGAQFTPPITHQARELSKLFDAYPKERRLMLVAEKDGRIVGGVMGSENVLRIIALEPGVRRKGLGRRLIQTYEVGAMRLGVQTISLGALEGAKGFYLRVGSHGKSSMHKELPLPGRVLKFRLQKLEALIVDLERGQIVQTGADGKVPSLF